MNWLLRLATWDGLLPAAVWGASTVLLAVLPRKEEAVVLTVAILPAAALIVRFYVGRRMIDTNACTPGFRKVQLVCLCAGLLVLTLLDTLLMTLFTLELPQPANPTEELAAVAIIVAMFYTPYLLFLAVAMYPGPAPRPLVIDEFARPI
jgi:NADH:ubiquinone oxidoreductase subunit 6 (subunit J)